MGSNQAGTLKIDYRILKGWLESVVKRYPHLPPTPVAMLLEIGMTGRNPAYGEILDQLLESDPTEYKAAIRANPWLTHGWVPLEVQMDALKAVLPYLMPRLESMASIVEDDSRQAPSDEWARAAATDPILRKRLEMMVMGRLPMPDTPPAAKEIPEQ